MKCYRLLFVGNGIKFSYRRDYSNNRMKITPQHYEFSVAEIFFYSDRLHECNPHVGNSHLIAQDVI